MRKRIVRHAPSPVATEGLDQRFRSSCLGIESHSCFLETLTILSIHGNSAQLISGHANGPALV